MLNRGVADELDPAYLNRRLELLREAMEKPIRMVLQIDCDDPTAGGELSGGVQPELRRTDFPVRVQVIAGTGRGMALMLLREAVEWLERDWDFLMESGAGADGPLSD